MTGDFSLLERADEADTEVRAVDFSSVLALGSRRSTSSRRQRGAGVVVLLAVAALLAFLLPLPRVHLGGNAAASTVPQPSPRLVIALHLDQTSVRAGGTIHGELFVTNETASTISVPRQCPKYWLEVRLYGKQIPFEAFFPLPACIPSLEFPPGTTHYPVTVIASYDGCSQTGRGTVAMPACLPEKGGRYGIPPLPPGTYYAKVATAFQLSGTRLPPPITVTVLPATG